MAHLRNLLLLGAVVAAPAMLSAVQVTFDVDTLGVPRISENRRNPGNAAPIAAGDFNGDGVDDLAIGSPKSAAVLTANSGNVFVIFGSNPFTTNLYYDLTAQPDEVANGLFSQVFVNSSEGFQLLPERGGEEFGSALAAGDFDGDGFDDLAVSQPAPIGVNTPGAVYVLYGRDNTATSSPLAGLELIDTEIFDDNGFEIRGESTFDFFGEHIAMADIDGDGKSDLIIGSPRNPGGAQVHVIWGRDRTPSDPAQKLRRSQIGTALTVTQFSSATTDEQFGYSFAVGDIQGSPLIKELFVGAPSWPGGVNPRGRVMAFQIGKPLGGIDSFTTANAFVEYQGTELGAEFGYSIAYGEFTGPPVPPAPGVDLVIGAPGSDFQTGKVYIVRPPDTQPVPVQQSVPGAEVQTFEYSQGGARLGHAVAIQSVDAFPGRDLIVSAPGYGPTIGGLEDQGRVLVISGPPTVVGSPIDIDNTALNGISLEAFPDRMEAGYFLAFGDFDPSPNPPAGADLFQRRDVAFSGSGAELYDPACTSNVQTDWIDCHAAEAGTRSYLATANRLSTSESTPAWSMLP